MLKVSDPRALLSARAKAVAERTRYLVGSPEKYLGERCAAVVLRPQTVIEAMANSGALQGRRLLVAMVKEPIPPLDLWVRYPGSGATVRLARGSGQHLERFADVLAEDIITWTEEPNPGFSAFLPGACAWVRLDAP